MHKKMSQPQHYENLNTNAVRYLLYIYHFVPFIIVRYMYVRTYMISYMPNLFDDKFAQPYLTVRLVLPCLLA
jgi:hypothetical protein